MRDELAAVCSAELIAGCSAAGMASTTLAAGEMGDANQLAVYRAVSDARASCRRGVHLQIAARCAATLYGVDPEEVIRRTRDAEAACEQSRVLTQGQRDDNTYASY